MVAMRETGFKMWRVIKKGAVVGSRKVRNLSKRKSSKTAGGSGKSNRMITTIRKVSLGHVESEGRLTKMEDVVANAQSVDRYSTNGHRFLKRVIEFGKQEQQEQEKKKAEATSNAAAKKEADETQGNMGTENQKQLDQNAESEDQDTLASRLQKARGNRVDTRGRRRSSRLNFGSPTSALSNHRTSWNRSQSNGPAV